MNCIIYYICQRVIICLTYITAYESHLGFSGYPYYCILFEVRAEAEERAEYRTVDAMVTMCDSVRINVDGLHY